MVNNNEYLNDIEFGEMEYDGLSTIYMDNKIYIGYMKNYNSSSLYFIAGLYYGDNFKFMRLSLLRPESLGRKYEDIFTLEEMNLIINKLKEKCDQSRIMDVIDGSVWVNILNYFNNENIYEYEDTEYGKPIPLDYPMPDYTLLCK